MRQEYWGGVTTPSDLAKCLSHTLVCAPRFGDFLSIFDDSFRIAGDALRRASERMLSLIQTDKFAPAEASLQCSADLIDRAREGTVNESDFVAEWAVANFAKKFRYGCLMSPEEAAAGFLKRNLACRCNLRWDVASRMRTLLSQALPFCETAEGRFGPGATLEKANTWPEKVAFFARLRGRTGLLAYNDAALEDAPPYAKLHAVPKDFKKLRLITVEPLVASWHQQAARSTILRSVHNGILKGSIMDQTLSQTFETAGGVTMSKNRVYDPVLRQRDRCRRGARDGTLVTIDLSDASDTISWEAVSTVFPAWCLALLDRARSANVIVDGCLHPLHIYAGMGNATTFVVETLYFWALFTVIGELAHAGKPAVSVFGDDIVMNGKVARSQWFQGMIRESGALINWSKSGLSAGPGFREACGLVSYKSIDVPFTPRFYGYAGTKEGAIGYCELCSRLINSSLPEFKLLGLGLMSWDGAPRAPLIRGNPNDVGAVLAYCLDDCEGKTLSAIKAFIPCHSQVKLRWNVSFQRKEAYIWTSRAKTASLSLRDPVWGTGVSRSWGWWAYKLALLGQTTHDAEILRKSRRIRYAIAHRTSVHRRWVPVSILS